MKTRLSSWKCHSLNKAGRTSLIKSTQNNLPVYWLSVFKAPKYINSELDKIRRGFFRKEMASGSCECRRMNTLNWSTLCHSKSACGLGLKILENKNDSILSKWWWKYSTNKSRPWRRVLIGKYGVNCLNDTRQILQRKMNLKISPVIKSIASISDTCFETCCSSVYMERRLGNGEQI